MTAFQRAYDDAVAAANAARRASDLDFRINRRYRLWERSQTPDLIELGQRLSERKSATYTAAETAEHTLDRLWDRVSREWCGAIAPPGEGRPL